MRIGKRNFPYPVLNNQKDLSTIQNSSFELHVEIEQNSTNCVLKNLHYKIHNEYLNSLIKDEIIKIFCVIECSATVYRKIIEITNEDIDVNIPIFLLRDKVNLSAYGIAIKDIHGFYTKDFIPEYIDYEFNINKNDIILIDDGFSFKVDYDEVQDKKISSIFVVVKDTNQNQLIEVTSNGKKIVIRIPEDQFNKFDNMKQNDNVRHVFFSMLIIPALFKSLSKIQLDLTISNEFDDLDDIVIKHGWFKSIQKQFNNIYNYELSFEEFKQIDAYELAQRLMDFPIVKGLDDTYRLTQRRGDDDED